MNYALLSSVLIQKPMDVPKFKQYMLAANERIAQAKKVQETCGCKEKGLAVYAGGYSYVCPHYNFAAVFPELVPFWKDNKDPRTVAPRSHKKVMMICKRECGSDPYPIGPADYVINLGCDGCTGKGQVINLILERTVAGNKDMLRLWSPENPEDPATVPSNNKRSIYFWQCPKDINHKWEASTAAITEGHGCNICWNGGCYTVEQVKAKFEETHGSRFTYDWSTYTYTTEKMDMFCSEHGKFRQSPINHYAGSVCRDCSYRGSNRFDVVLEKFRAVWGDLYEYDEDTYISSIHYMTIICSVHGRFQKTPASHTQKGQPSGCQKCSQEKRDSAGVRYISRLLMLMSIEFLREEYFDDLRSDLGRVYYFDFLLKMYRLIIEYDGEQHFNVVKMWKGVEGLRRRQESDQAKDKYAVENGYSLVRIPYWAKAEHVIAIIHSTIKFIEAGLPVYISYKNYQEHVKSPNHYTAYWKQP